MLLGCISLNRACSSSVPRSQPWHCCQLTGAHSGHGPHFHLAHRAPLVLVNHEQLLGGEQGCKVVGGVGTSATCLAHARQRTCTLRAQHGCAVDN